MSTTTKLIFPLALAITAVAIWGLVDPWELDGPQEAEAPSSSKESSIQPPQQDSPEDSPVTVPEDIVSIVWERSLIRQGPSVLVSRETLFANGQWTLEENEIYCKSIYSGNNFDGPEFTLGEWNMTFQSNQPNDRLNTLKIYSNVFRGGLLEELRAGSPCQLDQLDYKNLYNNGGERVILNTKNGSLAVFHATASRIKGLQATPAMPR